jgi:signal transduction histidine kinase
LYEQTIRKYNIDLRFLSTEPVTVFADENQIRQVLINLLKNAIEATKTAEIQAIEILIRYLKQPGDTAAGNCFSKDAD